MLSYLLIVVVCTIYFRSKKVKGGYLRRKRFNRLNTVLYWIIKQCDMIAVLWLSKLLANLIAYS